MQRIRKQPKRKTKKVRNLSFRNPFKCSMPFLPFSINEHIKDCDRIYLNIIEDLICVPDQNQ